MTSKLKIHCLLKTTAKKFWPRQRTGGGGEKSHVLRPEEEEGEVWQEVWVVSEKVCVVSKKCYDLEWLFSLNEVILFATFYDEN